MWPVTQPVLLSLRRCTGDVVFLSILRSGQARPETKPRRVSGDRLGGTDHIPSNAPVDFHSHVHSEHQVLLSVLGNAVY